MIRCQTCQTANLDTSRFCDECGNRLVSPPNHEVPAYVPPPSESPRPANVTSVGIPPVVGESAASISSPGISGSKSGVAHASLVIERGETPGMEFRLVNDESTIGRWDADNGV